MGNKYQFEEAMQALNRALKISETKFGTEHPITADIVYTMGCVFLMQQGKSKLPYLVFEF